MRTAIEILQFLSTGAFLTIAFLTLRTWRVSRDRADLMGAVAMMCLGSLGLIARLGALAPSIPFLGPLSSLAFICSGLALMEVRDSIVPVRRRVRVLLRGVAGVLGVWLMIIGSPTSSAVPYTRQQSIAISILLALWTYCVIEPVICFLRAARSRPPIVRARLRMLSVGYVGVVLVVLLAVSLRSEATLTVSLFTQIFAMLLVPFFFVGLSPPHAIRQRWLAREAQRESARMLLTLPAIVWSTDSDLRITSSNGGGLSALGQQPNGYAGASLYELYDRIGISDTPFARTSIEMHLRALAGESVTFESERDGRTRENWLEPLTGPDGRAAGVLGLAIDISERKRTENALAEALLREHEAAEHLRALDHMKTAFMTAVSHELRTPLASVVGFASTLRREAELTSGERSMVITRLIAAAHKLQDMLTDLLDLDRVARGIIEPARRRTNVTDLVQQVVVGWCEDSGRAVELDLQEVWCAIDGAKAERIVENLLSNAARYAPAGSPVWVRVQPEDDGVLIVVEDSGPGVPAGMRESIFEPFRQGEPRSAHSPGVGIGLSLVARFSEMHGGRAWVEPRAGGGASFHVFLANAAGRVLDPVADVVERAG